jgi:zinc and cadmium transporter
VAEFSSIMLPLAAGGFIYIAGSDLVPELNKESTLGKSVVQMLAIGVGVGLMFVLVMLED